MSSPHFAPVPPSQPFCEWRTLALWGCCCLAWLGAAFYLPQVSGALAVCVMALVLVLQSSLSHEALHGHPFRSQHANTALGLLAVGLFVPYLRFQDTHLAHHVDERLTDPYDDPESNYLSPAVWAALPTWRRALLRGNNTLAGRMMLGPILGQLSFMRGDFALIWAGDARVALGWGLHVPGVMITLTAIWHAPMSLGAYLLAAYLALGILKIRTFLEHQAKHDPAARTVIVEDRGPLAFLFLNNNLHVVHHLHPKVPWYDLPQLYRDNKQTYQRVNEGYVYPSYAPIFRKYLLQAKDAVAHPLWPIK